MLAQFTKKLRTAMSYADMIPATVITRLGLEKRTKYLFEDSEAAIVAIENDPSVTTREVAWQRLRSLGLDDFGCLLWSMPNERFPKLSRLLPAMASVAAQRLWTGNSGVVLLKQGLGFVRAIAYTYGRLTGNSLEGRRILDFGCGYGRIARLMYYFTDEENFFGVDPWDESIRQCNQAGLSRNILQSAYLPTDLPVGGRRFDVIYAYSVFTHLSRRATLAALRVLRQYVEPSGMLAITIRPIEFWRFAHYLPAADEVRLEQAHRTEGFAFRPHDREAVGGDITYGDTSMTIDWIRENVPDWRVRVSERRLDDRMQTYVFLTPE